MKAPALARPLGTMVAFGFARGYLETDLALAQRLGARWLEILPDWRAHPDAAELRVRVADRGFTVHSAHGCWGAKAMFADRVDLGDPDVNAQRPGLDDLKRCVDWINAAGGAYLVVHPGGLSDPDQAEPRRAALARGLEVLADHARGSGVIVCVENMPPGVHPGSRMSEIAEVLHELGRAELALALDTGHANMTASASSETLAAGALLRTTHVHDNNGEQDTHEPPGCGTVDWDAWLSALDCIGYDGPIMLECIRHLRNHPECIDRGLMDQLERLTSGASNAP